MCVTEIVRSWLGLDLVLGSVHIATDLSSEDRARERRGAETLADARKPGSLITGAVRG